MEPVGLDGPYVAGGPVGPYGTLSPFDTEHVGPVGPYAAGWPVGPYGMLSPSDSEPAGSVGPYVAGGPVGPYGMLSPFNSDPAGPVGPYVSGGPIGMYGTLSPSDSEPVGPYVAGGPVGPYGTLSPFSHDSAGPLPSWALVGRCPHPILLECCFRPCLLGYCSQWARWPYWPVRDVVPSDSGSAILVDPGGVFPSSDLARIRGPDTLAESASLMGPAMSLGVLPPSDTELPDPVMPRRVQSSSIVEFVGPLGPGGTLLPGEIVPTDDLVSVAAVPLPAVRDPVIVTCGGAGKGM